VRTGKDERFVLPADEVPRLLYALLSRVPWAMSGFDARHEQRWRMDREQLADTIQTERQQIQSLSAEACQSLIDGKVKDAEEMIRIIRDRDPRRG